MRVMSGPVVPLPFAPLASDDGWTVPVSVLSDADENLIPGDLLFALRVARASYADELCVDSRFAICPDLPVYEGDLIVEAGAIASASGATPRPDTSFPLSDAATRPDIYHPDDIPENRLDRRGDTPLAQGDYTLQETVWIGAGEVSVRISPCADGLSFGAFRKGAEDEDPVWFAAVTSDDLIASEAPSR